MFGYIVPDKPELKLKEFELFRAYYCGLCRSIGDRCGRCGRLALNYDITFLGILLSSLRDAPEKIGLERCIAHPFRRRPMVEDSGALGYASDMNMMLAHYKAADNIEDGRSLKSLASLALFSRGFSRASSRYRDKARSIYRELNRLSEIEAAGSAFIDESAEPFADLTAEMFAYEPVCGTEDSGRIMRSFGYNVGKWIYVLDAFDDIEEDVKNKNFNPILNQFCYNGEKVDDFKDRVAGDIKFVLTYTLSEAGEACERMQLKKNRGIIENIVYGGMGKKTLQILDKRSRIKDEKPIRGTRNKARGI